MDAQSILENFDYLFEKQNIVAGALRQIAWWLVLGLAWLNTMLETMVHEILTLNGFFDYSGVTALYNKIKPLLVILFTIALIGTGYLILSGKHKDYKTVFTNILYAIAVIILLPVFMTTMNTVVTQSVDAVTGEYSSMANKIIDANVADLYVYDDINFNVEPHSTPQNNISESDIEHISVNAPIDKEKVSNTEVFTNELDVDESTGELYLKELGEGLFENDQTYYRYDINFVIIIVALCVTSVTLISFGFKLGKIMFELAFNKIFGTIVAVADINGGQRTKQVLQDTLALFLSIIVMVFMMELFIVFSSYVSTSGVSSIAQIVLLCGGSAVLLKGPSIVEKTLGINASLGDAVNGIKSGLEMAEGGMSLGKGALAVGAGAVGVGAGAVGGYKFAQSQAQPQAQPQSKNAGDKVPKTQSGQDSNIKGIGANAEQSADMNTDMGANAEQPADMNTDMGADVEQPADMTSDMGADVEQPADMTSDIGADVEQPTDMTSDMGADVEQPTDMTSDMGADVEQPTDMTSDMGADVEQPAQPTEGIEHKGALGAVVGASAGSKNNRSKQGNTSNVNGMNSSVGDSKRGPGKVNEDMNKQPQPNEKHSEVNKGTLGAVKGATVTSETPSIPTPSTSTGNGESYSETADTPTSSTSTGSGESYSETANTPTSSTSTGSGESYSETANTPTSSTSTGSGESYSETPSTPTSDFVEHKGAVGTVVGATVASEVKKDKRSEQRGHVVEAMKPQHKQTEKYNTVAGGSHSALKIKNANARGYNTGTGLGSTIHKAKSTLKAEERIDNANRWLYSKSTKFVPKKKDENGDK